MNALAALVLSLVTSGIPSISNADFESVDGRSGLPSNWGVTFMPDQPNLVRYEVKAGDAPGDTRALGIHIAAEHPQKKVAYNAHQDITGITAGQKYRISAQVKTEKLSTMPILMVQCLAEGQERPTAFFSSPSRKLTADIKTWESIETTVSVPEGTQILRLRIGIPGEDNAGGTAWLDNVSITELN